MYYKIQQRNVRCRLFRSVACVLSTDASPTQRVPKNLLVLVVHCHMVNSAVLFTKHGGRKQNIGEFRANVAEQLLESVTLPDY